MLVDTLEVGSACRAEPDSARGANHGPESNAAPGSARQAEPTRRKRKPWAPNENDRSIHEWVMLKGEKQSFVADLFGISQATVSRIVERVEKWRAHAGPREDGGLDPAERVRAQRVLTYERNERIIRNCLRLAGEMERCADVSNSVHKAPDGGLAGMREIHLVNKTIERSGMASRFMRLAFRAGMEQLELVEKEPAVMPAPLTDEEEAEQEAQAAADRAELQAVRQRHEQSIRERLELAEQEAARAREQAAAAKQELEGVLGLLAETQQELKAAEQREEEREMAREGERETGGRGGPGGRGSCRAEANELDSNLPIRATNEAAVVELNLHNLHSASAAKNGASANGDCVCDTDSPENKNRAKVNNGRPSARPSRTKRGSRPRSPAPHGTS